MLRIRLVEEAIACHYGRQLMRCPVHLSIGQEAVAVGTAAALRGEDYVFSGHRSHAHYLAKGGSLDAMIAELHGKVTGCCQGAGGSMHLIDRSCGFLGAVPIVASTIPIAVGAALSCQMDRSDRLVVVFFGEGATEEGVFHESMNFASVKKLPILFVCENNFYSVYTPMDPRQPSNRKLTDLGLAHGVTTTCGDGNDAEEVFQLVSQAAKRARSGQGPQFLVFDTYRWREHCGPNFDNDIGYRTEAEYLKWKEACPLEKIKVRLQQGGLWEESKNLTLQEQIAAEIQSAFEKAEAAPFPDAKAFARYLFAS